MAVTRVRKLFPGRGGKRNFETRVTYTLVYEVVTDSPADDENTVYGAVDPTDNTQRVPTFGDAHPGNPNAVVVDVSPQQSDESSYIWYVDVVYDTQPDTPGNLQPTGTGGLDGTPAEGNTTGAYPENPLNRAAKWQMGAIDRQEVCEQWLKLKPNGEYVFKDYDAWQTGATYKSGKFVKNGGNVYFAVHEGSGVSAGGPAGVGESVDGTCVWAFWATYAQTQNDPRYIALSAVANSAGLPFDPPSMVDVSIPTIIVTKNLPVMDIVYAMNLKNCINVLQWGVVPPRCGKVLRFTCNLGRENKIDFVECQWEVGLNPDTWDLRILDAGWGRFQTRFVPNGAPPPDTIAKQVFTKFIGADGQPVGQAVPMDGGGSMLQPTEEPVFLRGVPRQCKLIDFNQLIPWDIPR